MNKKRIKKTKIFLILIYLFFLIGKKEIKLFIIAIINSVKTLKLIIFEKKYIHFKKKCEKIHQGIEQYMVYILTKNINRFFLTFFQAFLQ